MIDDRTNTRMAASLRYNSLDSITRRMIDAAADDLLKRTDWNAWSLLTSSPTRCRLLRDARFSAFLAWERHREK